MNHLGLICAGVIAAFGSSWLGMVAYPYLALGRMQSVPDEETGGFLPPTMPGLAEIGQKVYAENGCVSCHSQQVRQTDITKADILRGWGQRPTVARDFMRAQPAFLGTSRIGPDLANIGARQEEAAWFHRHLYEPEIVTPGSNMPSSRYLYRMQKIQGQRSKEALVLRGPHAPKPGYEVVPTESARALVVYLMSLNRNYALPEMAVEPLE